MEVILWLVSWFIYRWWSVLSVILGFIIFFLLLKSFFMEVFREIVKLFS